LIIKSPNQHVDLKDLAAAELRSVHRLLRHRHGLHFFSGFTAQQDTTFAARATRAPINNRVGIDSHVLHVGASVRTREVGEDQPLLTYRARCGDLHMTNFCVNTGSPTGISGIGDGDTFWGLEAAGLWGPFSAQGEYGHLGVDLPSPRPRRCRSNRSNL
jgi:phosphate-selective porin